MFKAVNILLMFLLFTLIMNGQEEKKRSADVVEYMKITNVQLIVRAMKGGKPVGGLKASDFSLYENRQKTPITSFREVRRQIGESNRTAPVLKGKQPEKKDKKGRFFLFYYWLSEPGLKYREAFDYFFKKVFKVGDRVLLVVRDKYLWVKDQKDIEKSRAWLEEKITRVTEDFIKSRRGMMNSIEGALASYVQEMSRRKPDPAFVERFKKDLNIALQQSWNEYQNKYLILNYKLLELLAGELDKITVPKWAMIFFQESAYPIINYSLVSRIRSQSPGAAGFIEGLIRNYRFKVSKPDVFFLRIKKIQQSFVNGNTTFHFLYMPPGIKKDTSGLRFSYADFEMETTYSGWRQALKEVTKATGGEVVRAAHMKESMKDVVHREDIYYQITYSPGVLKKQKREIVIKLKDPGIKIFHMEKVDLNKKELPPELQGIKLKSGILTRFSKMDGPEKKSYLIDAIINDNWEKYFNSPQHLPLTINNYKPGPVTAEIFFEDVELNGEEIEICLVSRDRFSKEFSLKTIKQTAKVKERITFTRQEGKDYFIIVILLSDSRCFYNAI